MTLFVRPATIDDVKHFFPDIDVSFRAWVAEVDGVVSGMVGLALTRPIACLISATGDALRPFLHSMPVLRAIKRVHDLCRAYSGPIMAKSDPDEPTSPAILRRMGFEYLGEFDGEIVYQMRRG